MGLRILLSSRIYAPESGAAAYRLAALVSALEEADHNVVVLTTRSPLARRSEGKVRRWPVLRDKGGAVRGYVQYLSFDVPLFFRLLFSRRYDVLIVEPPPTTGIAARLASSLRRRPYVYFSADVSTTAAEGIGVSRPVVQMVKMMERWVLGGAAAILSVSPGVTAEVRQLAGSNVPVVEVGTGVDTLTFRPDGARSAGDRTFVYAGTMSEIQGAGVFVDAFLTLFGRYRDVRLLMFGQGVELEALRSKAARAGDQIQFPGTASGEVVAQAMRSSVAGLASVRPARGYDFAFATKALATLACGVPVIYAGTGPVGNLVKNHGLGWAVDWDRDQVARAMEQALESPADPAAPQRIAGWVNANYSLTAVGRRAARAVEEVAARS